MASPKRTFALGQAPNAKIGVSPNDTSFASKWNIGFRLRNTQVYYDYKPTPIYPKWSRMGVGGGGGVCGGGGGYDSLKDAISRGVYFKM